LQPQLFIGELKPRKLRVEQKESSWAGRVLGYKYILYLI
jgi:hypothetical protein